MNIYLGVCNAAKKGCSQPAEAVMECCLTRSAKSLAARASRCE